MTNLQSNGANRISMPSVCIRHRGFTLIELMITVAVVAILASVAMASYNFAVVKSRRSAVAGCLLERAQFMERHYTTNMTYAGAADPAQCGADVSPHYTLAFSGTPDGTTFVINAVPKGSQEKADTKCGTLSINAQGVKGKSGTGSVNDCW
jgi:type IV pilus assembly protein PilE